MIQLMIMDADELKLSQNFNRAMVRVGEARREKANRIMDSEKKRLSLAAGLLLRHAFHTLHCADLYDEIAYTPLGKPFLPREEYYFSVSHSGKFAICGFSDQPIGCDIERKRENLPRFSKIFSCEEGETFTSLNETEKITFFFRLWTGKESVTKWMGQGITFPFRDLSVMEGKHLKSTLQIHGKTLHLKSFSVEEYLISVCGEGADFPRKITKISWNQVLKD